MRLQSFLEGGRLLAAVLLRTLERFGAVEDGTGLRFHRHAGSDRSSRISNAIEASQANFGPPAGPRIAI